MPEATSTSVAPSGHVAALTAAAVAHRSGPERREVGALAASSCSTAVPMAPSPPSRTIRSGASSANASDVAAGTASASTSSSGAPSRIAAGPPASASANPVPLATYATAASSTDPAAAAAVVNRSLPWTRSTARAPPGTPAAKEIGTHRSSDVSLGALWSRRVKIPHCTAVQSTSPKAWATGKSKEPCDGCSEPSGVPGSPGGSVAHDPVPSQTVGRSSPTGAMHCRTYSPCPDGVPASVTVTVSASARPTVGSTVSENSSCAAAGTTSAPTASTPQRRASRRTGRGVRRDMAG